MGSDLVGRESGDPNTPRVGVLELPASPVLEEAPDLELEVSPPAGCGKMAERRIEGHKTEYPEEPRVAAPMAGRDPAWTARVADAAGLGSQGGRPVSVPRGAERPLTYAAFPSGGYADLDRGYIHAGDMEACLAHYGRSEEFRGYLRGDGISACSLGQAICNLLASRDRYRRRALILEQELTSLHQEVAAQRLQTQMTTQSLQLLSAELTAVTERCVRGVGSGAGGEAGGSGQWRGEAAEGTAPGGGRKRARGNEW